MSDYKKHDNDFAKQTEKNKSIKQHLYDRISHIGRKMSRGASNIFRSIKPGNYWHSKEPSKTHDHHKPGQGKK